MLDIYFSDALFLHCTPKDTAHCLVNKRQKCIYDVAQAGQTRCGGISPRRRFWPAEQRLRIYDWPHA